MKAQIFQAAGPRAPLYTNRLAAIEAAAAAPVPGDDQAPDWQSVTRAYSRMDYLGAGYRCLAEEVRYSNLFRESDPAGDHDE